MRILVTGGTGFIGSNIVKALVERGDDVIITGHEAEQPAPKGVEFLQTSFAGLDYDRIGKVDAVIHEAAINSALYTDKSEIMRANLLSSQQLIEYVVSKGCTRIVYASSTAVYGDAPAPYSETSAVNPISAYGSSKLALDKWAMQFAQEHPDFTIVGLRYCNVFGPGESHKGKRASYIYQLAQQMLKGNAFLFKHGEQRRDWIYVKDVVRANLLALTAKQSGVYMCGGGVAYTFNEIVRLLNENLGLARPITYVDNPYEKSYQNYTECDLTKASAELGFTPQYSLAQGIADYYRSGKLVDPDLLKLALASLS